MFTDSLTSQQRPDPNYHLRFDRGVLYLGLSNIVMLDYDPNNGELDEYHYTISSMDEAICIVALRAAEYSETWRIYQTPSGGIHAFLMSCCMTPAEAASMMRGMKCDNLYVDLSVQRGLFGVRVSKKLGRAGDFVAKYLLTVGEATELSYVTNLMKYHDFLCRKYGC